MIIVSNTSPIANLTVVGYVDLLPQLFGAVVIPDVVYQELLANGENHPVTQTVMTVDWLDVRAVSDQSQVMVLERERRLDPGEANAIVLAIELKATQLLIDERLGRAEARRQGLRITIRVSKLACRLSFCTFGTFPSVFSSFTGIVRQALV